MLVIADISLIAALKASDAWRINIFSWFLKFNFLKSDVIIYNYIYKGRLKMLLHLYNSKINCP
jgi:hypothetical protein